MKILAFVDMHGSMSALKKIKELVKKEKPDYLVCPGDFTIFEQGLDYIMHKLNQIGIPVLIFQGNHESEKNTKAMCKLFENLTYFHDNHLRVGNVILLGFEGNGFGHDDPEFEEFIKRKADLFKKDDKIVLITHAPPYNTKVDDILDEHCGNKAIRRFIVKFKPVLNICGHIHENAGFTDKIGHTLIVNPGPFGKILVV